MLERKFVILSKMAVSVGRKYFYYPGRVRSSIDSLSTLVCVQSRLPESTPYTHFPYFSPWHTLVSSPLTSSSTRLFPFLNRYGARSSTGKTQRGERNVYSVREGGRYRKLFISLFRWVRIQWPTPLIKNPVSTHLRKLRMFLILFTNTLWMKFSHFFLVDFFFRNYLGKSGGV